MSRILAEFKDTHQKFLLRAMLSLIGDLAEKCNPDLRDSYLKLCCIVSRCVFQIAVQNQELFEELDDLQ